MLRRTSVIRVEHADSPRQLWSCLAESSLGFVHCRIAARHAEGTEYDSWSKHLVTVLIRNNKKGRQLEVSAKMNSDPSII